MVKNEIKNYGKSNRTKLLNLSKQTKGADYNLILLRFVQERLLYRLSLSAYRENFFLKGGALLYAHERFAARPTRDMDFLGDHINRDKENIKRIMLEICCIACEEDGVTFECGDDDIWLEDITVEQATCPLGLSVADRGASGCECGGLFTGNGGGREVPDDDRPRNNQQQNEGFL